MKRGPDIRARAMELRDAPARPILPVGRRLFTTDYSTDHQPIIVMVARMAWVRSVKEVRV